MIYVSQNMPIPKHDRKEEYGEKSIAEIIQLLEITQGKTLILFTSATACGRKAILRMFFLLKSRKTGEKPINIMFPTIMNQ